MGAGGDVTEPLPPTSLIIPSRNRPAILADTVASVIEQEVNGVDGMIYMYSQSTNDGSMSLNVTFEIGTDIDEAQVLVQNRVSAAEPRIPEDVRRNGITVRKNSPDLLLVVHLISPDKSYDQVYTSNYALLNVRDELARIPGVGSVNMFGAREYSMRVWLDPERIAARGMTAEEVMGALRAQNVQVAGGAIGQPPVEQTGAFQVQLQLKGRLQRPELHRLDVDVRGETLAPGLDDVRRVVGGPDRTDRLAVCGSDRVGVSGMSAPHVDTGHGGHTSSHSGGYLRTNPASSTRSVERNEMSGHSYAYSRSEVRR